MTKNAWFKGTLSRKSFLRLSLEMISSKLRYANPFLNFKTARRIATFFYEGALDVK
jgi:hypothetical protein